MIEAHEALLQQVVLGQLAESASEVRDLAARDPEFARELRATMAIVRALKQSEVLREAVLADVSKRPSGGLPPQASPAAPHPRRVARWLPLLAAGVIAMACLWWVMSDMDVIPGDMPLGNPGEITCVAPKDRVDDFADFVWTSDTSEGWFRLTVRDRVSGKEVTEDLAGAHTWDSRGKLDSTWDDIEWTIEWFNASNVRQPGGCSARAWRR